MVQFGEVGVDAGPQGHRGGVGGVGGQGGEVVDEVVLGGLDLLEPGLQRGGLGVGAGLLVAGPGREQFAEPFFAAGGEGVGVQAAAQGGQDEVVAGGDGAGVVGGLGDVAGVGAVVGADVVGVVTFGAAAGVGFGAADHPPLADFAPDPGPQQVGPPRGGVRDGVVPAGLVLGADSWASSQVARSMIAGWVGAGDQYHWPAGTGLPCWVRPNTW